MDKTSKICVTELDFDRLEQLLDSPEIRKLPGIESLWQELHRANVMPAGQIPANVVTMNSTVRFEDESAGTATSSRWCIRRRPASPAVCLLPRRWAARCSVCRWVSPSNGRCRAVGKFGSRCWKCCTSRKPLNNLKLPHVRLHYI